MKDTTRRRYAILVLWTMFGVMSAAFAYRSPGLAHADPAAPAGYRHAAELETSGGNDDICIEMGWLFAGGAVLWSGLRIRRPFTMADWRVNALLLGAQAFYLALIEQGSILDTIFLARSALLALWTLCYAGLIALVIAARVHTTNASR